MEDQAAIDLTELMKMFWKYRRRLNSAEPAQQELYDALIELDRSVMNKVGILHELYWNVLQKQTLTHRHKANFIRKAAADWGESLLEHCPQPNDLYEELIVELSRPKELPPWGITIIGGDDDLDDPEDPGIYIKEIKDNSIAQRSGSLLLCDRIIEVNGTDTKEIKHEVANELLSVRQETLAMKISRKGLPPESELLFDTLDVYLSTENPSKGFGIAIKGGRDDQFIDGHDGIFITHVSGVAAENGQIDKGDRIITANNTNLEHVAREDAISTIHSCPHMLHLKIQKRALLHLPQPDVVSSCIRQVVLKSQGGNYGLSVGGTAGKIYIIRLNAGGAAEKNGRIFLGDQLVAVGDNSTLNCSVDEVYRYLQNYPQQIRLKLAHAQREFNSLVGAGLISHSISITNMRDSVYSDSSYFRVNFDYNPKLDRECPSPGLDLTRGTIVRIDEYNDIVMSQVQNTTARSMQMECKWLSAVLVEDTHERLEGFIPSLYSLQQVRYPGVTLPKTKSKSSKKWLPTWKSDNRKVWQKHTFYSQIWKTEIDETRIILLAGVLNSLLVEMFINEYPDTYQTLVTLPPGYLEGSNNSFFAKACMNIIASKKHVLIAIGPELIPTFKELSPIIIVTYPVGVRTGSDMNPKCLSTSEGLLTASQLEEGQITANQIRNEFGIHISGIASGTNLGEMYYQVYSIIHANSFKKIVWSETAPEKRSKGFGPLSESSDLLETLGKVSC